ncbi:hypothetical protein [Streptomyces albiflavescens]|nr:hypothetical protein [Streptomyces albiflavescens]
MSPHSDSGRGPRIRRSTVGGERITAYEVIADPVRLRRLDLAVLDK